MTWSHEMDATDKTTLITPTLNPSVDMSPSWRNALLSAESTIHDAVRSLVDTGFQIALVVSSEEALIGTVTDGDIRRGLLRGLGLDSRIDDVVNREPFVVPSEVGRDVALQLMQANKIHQLPVIDGARRVVGLHLWDSLIVVQQRSNVMVIMAGGEGTRLRPHTENCPKPLLRVGGKPMLERIIESAHIQQFRRFTIAVRFLGHMIEKYFGDGRQLDVEIDYLREQTPLGTAGAIASLSPRPTEAFLVTNGDVLTDVNYGDLLDFHRRHNAAATMAVRLHEWQHPFGVVHTKGLDIIGFEEKPVARTHVNAGVYVLEPHVLECMTVGEHCDMPTLFTRLQQHGDRIIAYPMHEPWLDVGRVEDLELARAKHAPT